MTEKVKKSAGSKTKSVKSKKVLTDLDFVEGIKNLALKSLDDDKGQNIISIRMPADMALTDYMIVASGTSSRQVSSMADHLIKKLKEFGVSQIRVEGMQKGDWVLIDAGDIIVHIFRPEVRDFYDIERIWVDDNTKNKVSQIMHFSA